MKMKRVLALLLATVMLLSLCACSKKDENKSAEKDPDYLGKYISVQGEMMGMTMSGDEIAGFEIELKADGKGVMTIDGDSSSITYTVSDNILTIKIEGEEFVGTIGDDIIKIDDMLGMGLNLTFAREGSEAANPENWVDDTTKALIGTWTSYKVLDIMEDDASDKYDPAGMVLEIRADGTVSCFWQGQNLGDQEWDFFGGSAFLDNGVSFKFDDDQKELIVDFSDYDICDDYLTYYCRKGGEAPVSGSTSGDEQTAGGPGDPTDPDQLYGTWMGTFEISGSSGGAYADGIYDAVAYAMYNETGRPYFEVYVNEFDDAVLSVWGADDLDKNSMTPDVEDGESWILDKTITHDDAWDLMPVISSIDGSIPLAYSYDAGGYSCNISIRLTKDLDAPAGQDAYDGAPVSGDNAPALSGSKYGKSIEGADGIVPADKIMEAAMIVRGGFLANHFFSYEEIYELMGGVHGKPTLNVGWDEETRSHRYEWYPDNNPGSFFSAQFTVVDGEELGKTYQYPGNVSDTDGTPYEKKPAADKVGKSKADADGMTSRDGFKAFIKQRMDQKDKKQGTEMSYEQIAALCGCDGEPAYTDNWKADKHSYRWKVDDDIYYVADFAVLSTGAEIMTGGNGASDLEEKLGLK